MSSDFCAGYLSGAIGIIIGNPLDLVKVRLQAGQATSVSAQSGLSRFENATSLVKGAAAPILGYGALNAILFVAYNRSLKLLDSSVTDPTAPDGVALHNIWLAGAAGGLASWTISSPTEFIKCRAQLDPRPEVSSWTVAKDIFRTLGWRGLYFGGAITSIRDSVGYGFYFWSYEYCKRLTTTKDEDARQAAMKVLLCGGIAGIVTWASVFPLDVIKTRLQAQTIGDRYSYSPQQQPWQQQQQQQQSIAATTNTNHLERQPLLQSTTTNSNNGNNAKTSNAAATAGTSSSFQIAKEAYRTEGLKVFYRGLGICSFRAFVVNAVQWAMYEWIMKAFNDKALKEAPGQFS